MTKHFEPQALMPSRSRRTATGSNKKSSKRENRWSTEARMEVVARGASGVESITADLPVRAAGHITHLAIDRRVYQPGDTILFRSLTVDSTELRPVRTRLPVNYQLLSGKSETRVLET